MTMLVAGVVILGIGLFVGRPYCRFLCPYGALLRMAAAVSKWRVRITPDVCTQCRLCESSCPFGVIREPRAVATAERNQGVERRRFIALVALVPLLVFGGGWLGSRFLESRADVDRDVELAGFYLQQRSELARTNLTTAETLALGRAERSAETLLPEAVAKRREVALGGWIFGGWVGLVLGIKLAGFSKARRRTEYEPDGAGCFGCARCFESCPQERIRRGLPVDAAAVASTMPASEAALEEAR
jgi:ferredoxin